MSETPQPPKSFLQRAQENWISRHRLPSNFWLHVVGIPFVIAGGLSFFFLPWYWGVAGVFVGYLLQWLGHTLEGNDVGEWAAIKRMFGLPFVPISPRWKKDETGQS